MEMSNIVVGKIKWHFDFCIEMFREQIKKRFNDYPGPYIGVGIFAC